MTSPHNGVVGDLVDWGVGVGIDRDDHRRPVHAGGVLDLSGDPAGDVEFGSNRYAGLSYLPGVVGHAGVDRGTRCAHFSAEHFGQFIQNGEVFLAAHAVSAGDDDRCVLDVDFTIFDLTVDDAHHEIGIVEVFRSVDFFDDSFSRGLGGFFFHDAFTNRRHLRTVGRG